MSYQSVETYARRGCFGCCHCEGGSRNIIRTATLWMIGLFTCGFGLLVIPFFRKCVYCGHGTFLNGHNPHIGR